MEKKTSNAALNAARWSPSLINVAPSELFTSDRSLRSMISIARAASTCSLMEIGMPAARSSPMKSPSRLSNGLRAPEELLGRTFDVGLVLQQDVQRRRGVVVADLLSTEHHQRPGPVQGL